MKNSTLFNRAHYNILAAQIREQLQLATNFHAPSFMQIETHAYRGATYFAVEALVIFAIELAKRLKADNPNFDPVQFLSACSPNNDKYPLATLWHEERN